MESDTRQWVINRLTRIAERVASPRIKGLPDGYVAVPGHVFADLVSDEMEDDDETPLDPEQMRHMNLQEAMMLNDQVEPLVEHVRSIRRKLMEGPEGFTEEAAEHMAMSVFHSIIGVMVEED